jgi:hypothetical protein
MTLPPVGTTRSPEEVDRSFRRSLEMVDRELHEIFLLFHTPDAIETPQ